MVSPSLVDRMGKQAEKGLDRSLSDFCQPIPRKIVQRRVVDELRPEGLNGASSQQSDCLFEIERKVIVVTLPDGLACKSFDNLDLVQGFDG